MILKPVHKYLDKKKGERYYQGVFKPKHPEKYAGDPNNIIFRSGYEYEVFHWCDMNDNVLRWGSEEIYIPYYDPVQKKARKYYPDLIVLLKDKTGNLVKIMIEIKPYKQTIEPKATKGKSKRQYLTEVATYATNTAKWDAAKIFCQKNGLIFKTMTEKDIYKKKG
jgi:hypothetical protein